MVSNEQSRAFHALEGGGRVGEREEDGVKQGGGGISMATVKSPAVMFGLR